MQSSYSYIFLLFYNLRPLPFRSSYQFFINRPCQRTAHRLPGNPDAQTVKQAPRPLFSKHLLRRMHHVPVPVGHQLYARLDRIEWVRESRSESCRCDARDEVDARGGAGGEFRTSARFLLDFGCEARELPLRLFVEEDVQARVWCVAYSGCAEASEETLEALCAEYIS